jgi:hypothetical protein
MEKGDQDMTTAVAGRQLEQQREQLSFRQPQQQQPGQREQQHRVSVCAAVIVGVERIERPETGGLPRVRQSERVHSSLGFLFPKVFGTKTPCGGGVGSRCENPAPTVHAERRDFAHKL